MLTIPIEPLLIFLLVLVRVLTFFFFLPVFGDLFTPMRIRVLFAVGVSLVLVPLLSPQVLTVLPHSLVGLVALMLAEALLGMSLGMVGRLLFGSVQFAGAVMGEQIGFGMAQIIDPTQEAQIPILAEFLFISSLLVFFAVNGHHLFFVALARSFEQVPPGFVTMSVGLHRFFIERGSQMFVTGVQMSLPILAAVFVVNVGMGMIAKAVPQVHVFFESFPIRILVGLTVLTGVIGFMVGVMKGMFTNSLHDGLATVLLLLGM